MKSFFKRPLFLLYTGTALLFVLYLLIVSNHNLARHKELNGQIADIQRKINTTKNQVNVRYRYIDLLNNPAKLEQYGREKLNMHKPDEDMYIFVYE
ncbi:MAG: septum formation initiator family protein [Bacteroidales bacterium]|jgi:cell division protein FtsB|nr:septum formation initiator family protein [Bacteroidales bacterium]